MISELEKRILDVTQVEDVLEGLELSQDVVFLLQRLSERDFEAVLNQDQDLCNSTSVEELRNRVSELLENAKDSKQLEKYLSLLLTAVASFFQFLKFNLIGDVGEDGGHSFSSGVLTLDGEDVCGKLKNPQLLLISRMILIEPLKIQARLMEDSSSFRIGGLEVELTSIESGIWNDVSEFCPSWFWWAARIAYFHQKCLKHNSATLRIEIVALMEQITKHILDLDSHTLDHSFRVKLELEFTQWELIYRRIQPAVEHVNKVEELLRVRIEVEGALGTRTVHQVDPKAQLIATVQRSGDPLESKYEGYSIESHFDDIETPEDVLSGPKFLQSVTLTPLSIHEQCLALTKVDLIELGTANDELKLWEIEPYTQLIESQSKSTFLIRSKSTLLKIRHEKERNRTRERAYLTMERLIKTFNNKESKKDHFELDWSVFCVRFPILVQLRSEMSEFQVAFGEISSALETYEEFELWDELVLCYRLLQKTAIADEVVSRRLETDPNNPSLLCTLGDLRSSPKLYQESWTVSGGTYPRAQRSLGRSALAREDYQAASEAFELALELNSLHPDIWFSLGYCYLKLGCDESALKAFSRCAQIDESNGEAWNNLGALWMRQGRSDRALWALKEAVKYKRNNWETWENQSRAALACKEHLLCLRGLNKVLEISQGKRLSPEILVPLVEELLEAEKSEKSVRLMSKVLELLEQGSSTPSWKIEFWFLFGKVHEWNEDLESQKAVLKKCFRQVQGSQWKSDFEKFKLLIRVLKELVMSYEKADTSPGDFSALNLQIKSITKQAKEAFEDSTNELTQLESLIKDTTV